eukprot:2241881-Amphidinium_carterae.1
MVFSQAVISVPWKQQAILGKSNRRKHVFQVCAISQQRPCFPCLCADRNDVEGFVDWYLHHVPSVGADNVCVRAINLHAQRLDLPAGGYCCMSAWILDTCHRASRSDTVISGNNAATSKSLFGKSPQHCLVECSTCVMQ